MQTEKQLLLASLQAPPSTPCREAFLRITGNHQEITHPEGQMMS